MNCKDYENGENKATGEKCIWRQRAEKCAYWIDLETAHWIKTQHELNIANKRIRELENELSSYKPKVCTHDDSSWCTEDCWRGVIGLMRERAKIAEQRSRELEQQLEDVIDILKGLDELFIGYNQAEVCWGCDMNYSKHDKHDPDCKILAMHKFMESFQEELKRK